MASSRLNPPELASQLAQIGCNLQSSVCTTIRDATAMYIICGWNNIVPRWDNYCTLRKYVIIIKMLAVVGGWWAALADWLIEATATGQPTRDWQTDIAEIALIAHTIRIEEVRGGGGGVVAQKEGGMHANTCEYFHFPGRKISGKMGTTTDDRHTGVGGLDSAIKFARVTGGAH